MFDFQRSTCCCSSTRTRSALFTAENTTHSPLNSPLLLLLRCHLSVPRDSRSSTAVRSLRSKPPQTLALKNRKGRTADNENAVKSTSRAKVTVQSQNTAKDRTVSRFCKIHALWGSVRELLARFMVSEVHSAALKGAWQRSNQSLLSDWLEPPLGTAHLPRWQDSLLQFSKSQHQTHFNRSSIVI